MRRISILLAVVAVLLLCAFAAGRFTTAQEASPAAGDEFAPEGTTFEVLGFGSVTEFPSVPADFALIRLTLEPGAHFPVESTDPSLALVYIESGELTIAVDVPLTILHVAGVDFTAGATPAAPREVAAGEEVTVEAGDSFIGPAYAGGELRNDGAEPAVFLIANIAPTSGDGGGATPTP